MSFTTVLSVSVRPDKASAYEAGVQRVAARALEQKESFEWAAYQVAAGALGTIHFVTESPDWATIGSREPVDILIRRLLGETEGSALFDRLGECIIAQREVIGQARLDLSYPAPERPAPAEAGMVTIMRVRPGGQDACEELIRKVAQAIPAVGDPRRFTAYQTVVGDLRTYWTVVPLSELAELDRALSPPELLLKAFGAEGALLYRTGIDSIEHMERHLSMLRPDLSNGAWVRSFAARQPAVARRAGQAAASGQARH